MNLAADLLDAWLLQGTINGTLDWEQIEDPAVPNGDAAMRLLEPPFELHDVIVRCERTLRIQADGVAEEYPIDVGLYWAALGATARVTMECETCRGNKIVEHFVNGESRRMTCPACGGTGDEEVAPPIRLIDNEPSTDGGQ